MSQTLAAGESGFPDLWPRSDQVYVSQAKYPVDGLVMIYIYIYIYISYIYTQIYRYLCGLYYLAHCMLLVGQNFFPAIGSTVLFHGMGTPR